MRAACTQSGRAHDRLFFRCESISLRPENRTANNVRIQFVEFGNDFFSDTINAGSFDLVLHIRIHFFNHIKLFYLSVKFPYEVHGHGICHPQLQIRSIRSKYFFGILIRHTGRNNANFAVVIFHSVDFGTIGIFLHGFKPVHQAAAQFLSVCRCRYIFGYVSFVWNRFSRYPILKLYHALTVTYSGGYTQQHRCIESF